MIFDCLNTFAVTAEKLLYGGDALARRDDGKAIFIPYAVAGDRLLVNISSEKKNYVRAEILEILTPGEGRITPICPHFGICGGCFWQQIEYSRQVEAKRLILEELFHHRFPETRQLEITMKPCPQPFGYRSRARVQMQFCRGGSRTVQNSHRPLTRIQRIQNAEMSNKTAVGFFRGGSHIVEDIEECPLFRPRLNDALRALRQFPVELFKKDNIHEIDIACSEEDEKWTKGGDRTLLQRKIGYFTYNVSAGTFFQANDFMIDALVSHVVDCVSYTKTDSAALDLFSGVGLFSLPLARRFRAVTAVEYSRESHELCEMNAAAAGIENLENICADADKWLVSQPKSRFDCVVLDPPRAGVGTGVMKRIDLLGCGTIVYVSCDPQTLVRDLEWLDTDCRRIVSVAGFDMFPQTYHFETVVHLAAI